MIGRANGQSYEIDERKYAGRSTVESIWGQGEVAAGTTVRRTYFYESWWLQGVRGIEAHIATGNPHFYSISVTGWEEVSGGVNINYSFTNKGPSAFDPSIFFFIWYR